MTSPLTVLITRPQPQADRLAAALQAEWGERLAMVLSPLMQTRFLRPTLPPGPFASVILSSETGAQAAVALRQSGATLPDSALCVGTRTTQVAREGGFTVTATFPTAASLIKAANAPGPYLYLHGRDVSQPIDRLLISQGTPTQAAVVYDQCEMPLTDSARKILMTKKPILVPIYSARSARLLLGQLPSDTVAGLRFCAISETVLQALPDKHRPGTVVAVSPDAPGMLAAIRQGILSLSP